jgi:uracil permease
MQKNPFALGANMQDGGIKLLNWTIFTTFSEMNLSALPTALLAIVPIALVTIPESTAHVYQLDLYVNNLAKERVPQKMYHISPLLGENLIGDGIGDIISTFFGGPAGTNYGENISASAITKNFSTYVFGLTAILAIILSFTPLALFTNFIPNAVVNGASIYLFGVIASQGITLMIDKKVDMFDPKNLAIISLIFVIGLGGHYALPNGGFPLYKVNGNVVYFPALALAAISGILLNYLLNLIHKKSGSN